MSWAFQPLTPAAAALLQAAGTTGYIKVWDGTQWVKKPVKVWDGSQWVVKPLKFWNGATWQTTA